MRTDCGTLGALQRRLNTKKSSIEFNLLEQLTFALAFKDTPKEFTQIAQLLPGRTSKECQTHYEMNKWDSRFKYETMEERTWRKKLEPGSVASERHLDVTKLKDDDIRLRTTKTKQRTIRVIRRIAPIDLEILRLKKLILGCEDKLYWKRAPGKEFRGSVLPGPDHRVLKLCFKPPSEATDYGLLVWLRSADVLPLISQWWGDLETENGEKDCFRLQNLLPNDEYPRERQAIDLSKFAHQWGETALDFYSLHASRKKVFDSCARLINKIAYDNQYGFFTHTRCGQLPNRNSFSKNEKYLAATAAPLTAYRDLIGNPEGFFSQLLDTLLAGLVKPSVRPLWEEKYPFQGEEEERGNSLVRLLP